MHINLLPSTVRRDGILRRCLWQWLPIWIATCVLILGCGLISWRNLRSEEQALAELEQRNSTWSTMQTDAVAAARAVQALDQDRQQWRIAEGDPIAIPLLALLSRSVEAARGTVQIQRMQLAPPIEAAATPAAGAAPTPAPGAPPPAGQPARPLRALVLIGVARDDAGLVSMVNELKADKRMVKVDIKSLSGSSTLGLREWRVECGLQ